MEEDYRGGKYECEVLKWTLDSGLAGNTNNTCKVIKALPCAARLKASSDGLSYVG